LWDESERVTASGIEEFVDHAWQGSGLHSRDFKELAPDSSVAKTTVLYHQTALPKLQKERPYQLKYWSVEFDTAKGSALLSLLPHFSQLRVLELWESEFGSLSKDWLATLAKHLPSSPVESLAIASVGLSTDRFKLVASAIAASRVTHLSLFAGNDCDISSLVALQPNSRLTSLCLMMENPASFVSCVADSTLKELTLHVCSKFLIDWCAPFSQALAKSSSLSALHYRIIDGCTNVLQQLPATRLTSLSLPARAFDSESVKLLAQCPHLTSLNIFRDLSVFCLPALLAVLPETKLTALSVAVSLDKTSFRSFFVALPKSQLKVLNLSRSPVSPSDFDPDVFISALNSSKLEHLSLYLSPSDTSDQHQKPEDKRSLANRHIQFLTGQLADLQKQQQQSQQQQQDDTVNCKKSSISLLSTADRLRVIGLLEYLLRCPPDKKPGYFLTRDPND
jgi:hypothetical protein